MHKHLKNYKTFLIGVVFVDMGLKPTYTVLCVGVIDAVLTIQTVDQNQRSCLAVIKCLSLSLLFLHDVQLYYYRVHGCH